jgi:hypothetical protein
MCQLARGVVEDVDAAVLVARSGHLAIGRLEYISVVLETVCCPSGTYDVNASAKAALGLELCQCLRRFDILIDLSRVVHVHPAILCRSSQELSVRTHGQIPMLTSLVACKSKVKSAPSPLPNKKPHSQKFKTLNSHEAKKTTHL